MNFPRFWARGSSESFSCWRWSFTSFAEAQALASEAARQMAVRFREGDFPSRCGEYYPNRPVREQVLQELTDDTGCVSAVVTRNSYGCLILNTARIMFVDIDLPEQKEARGFLSKLFGKPTARPSVTPESTAIARIQDWTRSHSDWGWRVYKTRAGLRLLATHDVVAAESALVDGVFEALGSDPLYRKLCRTQKCFRARLTPKPWRCGVKEKPERWPWRDDRLEKRFLEWEAQYRARSANWATCQFIQHIGNPVIHPEVQSILKLHDDTTRVGSNLNLA